MPNLAEMQINSFQWLVKEGIGEILKEFSPVLDYTGEELALEFLDSSFDEPKFDENYSRVNNLS